MKRITTLLRAVRRAIFGRGVRKATSAMTASGHIVIYWMEDGRMNFRRFDSVSKYANYCRAHRIEARGALLN
jgi:hypothetical protein